MTEKRSFISIDKMQTEEKLEIENNNNNCSGLCNSMQTYTIYYTHAEYSWLIFCVYNPFTIKSSKYYLLYKEEKKTHTQRARNNSRLLLPCSLGYYLVFI